jgi:hypothetical protein
MYLFLPKFGSVLLTQYLIVVAKELLCEEVKCNGHGIQYFDKHALVVNYLISSICRVQGVI